MIVLDENITQEQRDLLREWHIAARHLGYDLGRAGIQDADIVPLLHQLRRPTFLTRDIDFNKRSLCHANYCLVFMAVGPDDVAVFARQLLRHNAFDTEAKRMGSVVRISRAGITVWRLHAEREIELTWPK